MKKNLSVLIPALNEEMTILEVVLSHHAVIEDFKNLEYEIIILNDGSSDRTGSLLQEQFSDDPKVRLVENTSPSGIANAYSQLTGLATGEWIYFTSADGQFPAECLGKLLQRIENGADLIVGDRSNRFEVYSFRRVVISWSYRKLSQLLFGLDPVDAGSVKLVRSSCMPAAFHSKSVARDLELILHIFKSNRRVEFVPVPFHVRSHGQESGNSSRLVLKTFFDILRLRILWSK